MLVRRVGKFTIAVGCDTYDDTINNINKIHDSLKELGIKCVVYLKKRLLITKGIIIKFIFKKHYYRFNRHIYGVKCDGCYGFNDEETYNITNGKNKCAGRDLVDYILNEEDIYGKRDCTG